MATDHIRYDLLVQDALRGVVRKVMGDVARNGLPGEHHFYISFKTQASGVRISNRLRERHPEDMTIVLQHQFWDLGITDHAFEVGLSFGGVPERLLVPFDALTGFFDPSVQFGLTFESSETTAENDDKAPSGKPVAVPTPVPAKVSPPTPPAAAGGRLSQGEPAPKRAPKGAASEPVTAPAPESGVQTPAKPAASADDKAAADKGEGSAEVLSLDAFRKKK